MTEPINLLNERLHEIGLALKMAYENNLDKEAVEAIVDEYNKYWISIQLLDSHSEIKYQFSRMYLSQGRLQYKISTVRNHRQALYRTRQRAEAKTKAINKPN